MFGYTSFYIERQTEVKAYFQSNYLLLFVPVKTKKVTDYFSSTEILLFAI